MLRGRLSCPLLLTHASMMFLCVINFDILRNLKESLLITRLGAEAIPFIKLWFVMPAACIFVLTYSFLANRTNKKLLFTLTMIPFLLWLPLFSFWLYPNLQSVAPSSFCNDLANLLPSHLGILCTLLEFWPLTILFITAELWSTGVLCTLFWTLVNDSNSINTSTQGYPVLTLLGNSASLLSGPMILLLVQHFEQSGKNGWQQSLYTLAVIFSICGMGIIYLYFRSMKLSQNESFPEKVINDKLTATQLTMKESIRYLIQSPYLKNMAIIMLGYCITINMIEVAWKSQLVLLYPTEAEYSVFMGHLTLLNGVATLILAAMTLLLMRKDWRYAALATPILMVCTGTPFFLATLVSDNTLIPETLGSQLLMGGVMLGTLCNVLSKSAKYTLFDATKEMAFVPLDNEQKLKGKASIELLVSRVGKSSSALVQQALIMIFGSLSASMHYMAGIFLVIAIIWLSAVNKLSRQYHCYQSKTP